MIKEDSIMLFSKLFDFFKDVFILEEGAHKDFFIQKLDPRVKLTVTFIGVISVILIQSILLYPVFLLTTLILARIARLPIKEFMLRSLVFIVFFTLLIALPLPFITPGKVIGVFTILGLTVTVTWEGLYTGLSLVLRVWTALNLLNLLVMTTGFDKISAALSTLRAPKLITILFDLTLKYIFVIVYEAARLSRAQEARRLRKPGFFERVRAVSPIIANIFLRSHVRANNMYNAMLARGFNGKYYSLHALKIKRVDITYFILMGGYFIILVLLDRSLPLSNMMFLLNI